MRNFVRTLKSFRHKNIKALFYLDNGIKFIIPKAFYRAMLGSYFKKKYLNDPYLQKRVNYYNKLDKNYTLSDFVPLKDYKFNGKDSSYFFDLYQDIKFFPLKNKIAYLFGDVTTIPKGPTLVKSRPIEGENQNSIILKLNKVRHYTFSKDRYKYARKKDLLVWRGHIDERTTKRIDFFKRHFNNTLCDIAATPHSRCDDVWKQPKLTIDEQLTYKFVLSIEGIDVATNLKWIMSSNSIAVMPKPEYETWFMEGTLIPDYHYISIKRDFSDLDEKLNYYLKNEDKALEIIRNAHQYIQQFKNKKQERVISLLVLNKYFQFQS
ncbi:glycosyl transferase family 90 [Saccharicrinis fermentans]|uniref:Glycosyl transferase CAP10 domain-containing protein n=1 Tax=Saccharicrinis fermentans DSM 9555 = JCM 21142 TaxID=869213 RepID=W7Y2M5_9BACT|nr:glycosyl transferase family 90 [Saccharicrinis fermentans]GAF01813.1 hypothetical protein JCM21142_430 [Saccharicrinis fermentans DSM 9555 = JCM 21142]